MVLWFYMKSAKLKYLLRNRKLFVWNIALQPQSFRLLAMCTDYVTNHKTFIP